MNSFGLGGLYLFPSGTTNPVEVAQLQDITTDFSYDIKELYGQYSFPVNAARGKGKVSLKASWAQVRPDVIMQILGGTSATGTKMISRDNAETIPATTPYTVTVTVPSSGTFVQNLQVVDVTDTTGYPIVFEQVDSGSEAAGKYSVAAGVYTFAAADEGKSVLISYEYSLTTGNTVTITNPIMGVAPKFAVRAYNILDGKQFGFYYPRCISSKLSLNMKLDDFAIPDFDITAYADAANIVEYWYIS
jgi:hypothetical protein